MGVRSCPVWLVVCLVLAVGTALSRYRRWAHGMWLGVFCLAYGYGAFMQTRSSQLPLKLDEPTQGALIGQVISVPERSQHATRWLVHADSWRGQAVSARVQLSLYGSHAVVHVGERWQWMVRLKPMHGLSNPGGFDWRSYQRFHHIDARGYVVSQLPSYRLHRGSSWSVNAIRERCHDVIDAVVTDPIVSSTISALTIGLRDDLSSSQWKILQRTGTSHLVSVSGLHITWVALMCYQLAYWSWCRCPALLIRYPAPWVAMSVSLIAAIGYAILSGWALPAQRACWMICTVLWGQCVMNPWPLSQRLLTAVLIMLVMNPLAMNTASFWLSVSATAWIGYAMLGRSLNRGRLRLWITFQGYLLIGLLPFNAAYFGVISGTGWLANAWAVPWVSFVVLPISLLGVLMVALHLPGAVILLHCSAWSLKPLWLGLTWMSHHTAWLWHHSLSGMALGCVMVATVLLCLPRGMPGRGFACCCFLPLLFPLQSRPEPGSVWMTVLDVGQGLAVVLQTATHVMVYDAGPHTYGGFDAGRQVVLPYWRRLNYPLIDRLMISHGDNDHAGGALALLETGLVRSLMTSDRQQFSDWHPKSCYAGQVWHWDGVQFKVMWPIKGMPYQGNNSSCVLRVDNGQKSILLTGDIEKPVEQQLLQHARLSLAATILVAPHHGSRTSSSWPWVQAVNPKRVIFSQGYLNRYHFPSTEVVYRYHRLHAITYATSREGAIRVKVPPKKNIVVQTSG